MKRIVVLVAVVGVGCHAGEAPERAGDAKRPIVKAPPAEGGARFFARGGGAGDTHELSLRKLTADVTTRPGTVHSHLSMDVATAANGQSEAVIRLPVPRGAAVIDAVLWVNDKPMRGAFVERQRANDIYTSIVTRKRDPALITWDGPGWIGVSIFPLEKDKARRFEIDWIEPAAVTGGRIQYRVPIVAEGERLVGRASLKVDGRKVPNGGQDLVAIALADPRKVFTRRAPGDPFQQVMVREASPVGAPHFVLIAETSAAMTIVDRVRQRAALDDLLAELPPDAKMTMLAADWEATPIVEDAGPAAWPEALAKLDAIPSAGALHLERALRAAAESARKTDAAGVLFVGVGADGFRGDGVTAPLAELRAAHLRLSAIATGGEVPQPLAKAAVDTGGEACVLRVLEDARPLIVDALRPRPSQPALDARNEGEWHQLKTVTGGAVWIGRALDAQIADDADTVRAGAGSPLAGDLASLWDRARLEWHDRAATDEIARAVTPVTSLLVLETDADYRRFGVAVPDPVAPPRAALQEQRNVGVLSLKSTDDGQLALARSIQAKDGSGQAREDVASIFRRDTALGNDAQDVLGGLIGNQVGESYGVGDLGFVGTGVGGGGTGEHTIGMGNLGTIGKYGAGAAGLGGRHARTPDVIPGVATVVGSLDKEIVRRIIRRHINEVRYCYDQALAKKPDLGGRIVAQFTISGEGNVIASVMQSSTLRSPAVEMCVANAIKRWEFPKPSGGGLAIVTYPFVLTPVGGEENGVYEMAPAPAPLPSRPIDDALAILSIGAGHERIERIATVLGLRPSSNAEALAWTINRQQDGGFETRLLVARLLELAHNRRDAIRVLSEAAAAHADPTAAELRRMGADGDAFDVLRLANR